MVRHPERDRVAAELARAGFEVKVHYPIPIHRQEPYSDGYPWELPVTERTVGEILSLPVTPELEAPDRDRLIDALLEIRAES